MKLVNTKKKIILGVVLIGTIAIAGLQVAGAGPWRCCPNQWSGPNCGNCDGYGYQRQLQLDEKTIKAHDEFHSETVELRKALATKQAEKRAIMLNTNPDAKRVAQLTGEIFDLREQLQAKAEEKGIDDIGFGPGWGRGCDGRGPRGFDRPGPRNF